MNPYEPPGVVPAESRVHRDFKIMDATSLVAGLSALPGILILLQSSQRSGWFRLAGYVMLAACLCLVFLFWSQRMSLRRRVMGLPLVQSGEALRGGRASLRVARGRRRGLLILTARELVFVDDEEGGEVRYTLEEMSYSLRGSSRTRSLYFTTGSGKLVTFLVGDAGPWRDEIMKVRDAVG